MTSNRGSYRRRGASTYQLRVSVDGERLERTVRASSDAEANLRLAEWTLTLGLAPASDAATMTVAELAEHYWAIEGRQRAAKTRREYRRRIDTYIVPALGSFAVAEITPVLVRRWFANLANGDGTRSGRPLTISTLRNVRAPLGRMFALAVELDVRADDPMRSVRLPKVAKTDPTRTVLERDEFFRLVDCARAVNPELADALWVAVATGARRGELCALRWSDVDLRAGRVRIGRSVSQDELDCWAETDTTKGRKPRTVTVDDQTVTILKAHRSKMRERALACGIRLAADAHVFSDGGDCQTFWIPTDYGKRYERIAKTAGLRTKAKSVRLHDLRATFVSWLVDEHVDVHDVMAAAGHETLAVTQAYLRARSANPAIGAAMGRAMTRP